MTRFNVLERGESPESAMKRHQREGRTGDKAELPDFAKLARQSIEQARKSGLLDEREAQRRAEAQAQREAKIEFYLRGFAKGLPADYRRYLDEPPPRTKGNCQALATVGKLEPGQSLHLFGESGNTKTHIAVWTAARLIRQHALSVRYYHVLELLRAFRDWEHEGEISELMRSLPILLIDDVDKGNPSPHARTVIFELYSRLEDQVSLITTANRSNDDLAELWGGDLRNTLALASRMSLMAEVEVTGPDHRPVIAQERNVN